MKIFPETDLGVNYGTARKMSSIQEWFGRILCQGMFWRGEYVHSIVEEQLSCFFLIGVILGDMKGDPRSAA